jgi:Xaa-Pro aminopeptidase
VEEVFCNLVIDPVARKTVLFIPRTDKVYEIWMTVLTKKEYEDKYDLEVLYNDELEQWIKDFSPSKVYLNVGVNSDSGLKPQLPDDKYFKDFETDKETLYDIMCEARVYKSDAELEVMRWASQVGCEAHIDVMRKVKPSMNEYHVESMFINYGRMKYRSGRVQPYGSICGCGPQAATLHYPENDRPLVDG